MASSSPFLTNCQRSLRRGRLSVAREIEARAVLGRDVAREAGDFARERLLGPMSVRQKASRDVVTAVDFEAEELIVRRIRERYPGDRIVSEEAGLLEPCATSSRPSGLTWHVDPLDGSNNYALALPLYGVAMALRDESEQAVAAIVHESQNGRTVAAVRNVGVLFNDSTRFQQPKSRPLCGQMGDLVIAWSQGHSTLHREIGEAIWRDLRWSCRRVLSTWAPSVDWVLLANGNIDGVVAFDAAGPETLAGILVAESCGLGAQVIKYRPAATAEVSSISMAGPEAAVEAIGGRILAALDRLGCQLA